jgi:hypothetical protein
LSTTGAGVSVGFPASGVGAATDLSTTGVIGAVASTNGVAAGAGVPRGAGVTAAGVVGNGVFKSVGIAPGTPGLGAKGLSFTKSRTHSDGPRGFSLRCGNGFSGIVYLLVI